MTHVPSREEGAGHALRIAASCVLVAVAAFYLLTEHLQHTLGALPYVIILLCPLMHVFMHRGHGGHGAHSEHAHQPDPSDPASGDSRRS